MTTHTPPKHFYLLDILRGVAALSVVLWHWPHFFLPHNQQGVDFSPAQQPFFKPLYFFYRDGSAAVQLFFCLSGFIFFWLYSKRVFEKTITLKSFTLLRLSRLYPLHFATLVFVAIGQQVYLHTTGTYFVYSLNDYYHFIINFLFISEWGLARGYSFNGPIWSVSIEMLLYALFFIFCRLFNKNLIALLVAVLTGRFVAPFFNIAVANGVECFFVGGILYIIYNKIMTTGDKWKVAIWLPCAAMAAWFITLQAVGSPPVLPTNVLLTGAGIHANTDIRLSITNWINHRMGYDGVIYILFPITILSLALLEKKASALGKRLSFLGDISYSAYVLHFPLQLLMAMIVATLAIDQTVFYSPWFMGLFFAVLILLSLISHYYFERPMQRIIRSKFNVSVTSPARTP